MERSRGAELLAFVASLAFLGAHEIFATIAHYWLFVVATFAIILHVANVATPRVGLFLTSFMATAICHRAPMFNTPSDVVFNVVHVHLCLVVTVVEIFDLGLHLFDGPTGQIDSELANAGLIYYALHRRGWREKRPAEL